MASAAAARQLVNIHFLLLDFSPSQLLCLDNEHLRWLPLLQERPPHDIHGAICEFLQASGDSECCLERIAWLRCWLLPWHHLEGLRLHILRSALVWDECPKLLRRMVTALRMHDHHATLAWGAYERHIAACLLIDEPESFSLEHGAVYVVLSPGEVFLAAHCMGTNTDERVQRAICAALGYVPLQMPSFYHEHIEESFRVGETVFRDSFEQLELYERFGAARHFSMDAQGGRLAASSLRYEGELPHVTFTCDICGRRFSSRHHRDRHCESNTFRR